MNAGTLTSKKDDFFGKHLSGSFFRRLLYELKDEMRENKGIEFFNHYSLQSMRAWFINEKLASGIPPSVVGSYLDNGEVLLSLQFFCQDFFAKVLL